MPTAGRERWLEGRIPVVLSLSTDLVQAQVALARYDVEFYSSAVSSDASIQQVIANRLQNARLALAYWEAQQSDTQN